MPFLKTERINGDGDTLYVDSRVVWNEDRASAEVGTNMSLPA